MYNSVMLIESIRQRLEQRRNERAGKEVERIASHERQLESLVAQALKGEITTDEYFQRLENLDTPTIDLRKAAEILG